MIHRGPFQLLPFCDSVRTWAGTDFRIRFAVMFVQAPDIPQKIILMKKIQIPLRISFIGWIQVPKLTWLGDLSIC